jgi:hypothetical protein
VEVALVDLGEGRERGNGTALLLGGQTLCVVGIGLIARRRTWQGGLVTVWGKYFTVAERERGCSSVFA